MRPTTTPTRKQILPVLLLLAGGAAASAEPNERGTAPRPGRSLVSVTPVRFTVGEPLPPKPGPPPPTRRHGEAIVPLTIGSASAPTMVLDGVDPASPRKTSATPLLVQDVAPRGVMPTPGLARGWQSLGPNQGGPPPDPALAVGRKYIVMAVNDDFAIYDKDGNKLLQDDFNDLLRENNDRFFDPKCTYDLWDHRYLCVVLRKQAATNGSWWTLLVSDDDNPFGGWYGYHLNARLYGGVGEQDHWADRPNIGWDPAAVYLTANMVDWAGSTIVDSKLRILDKAQIYNGLAAPWWDEWGFTSGVAGDGCAGDGTLERSLAPAQMHTWTGTTYMLNTKACGGTYLVLRRLTNVLDWVAGPAITQQTVPVGTYTLPPLPVQPSGDTLSVQSNYLTDKVVVLGAMLYASHHTGVFWPGEPNVERSALKLYRLQVGGSVAFVDKEAIYGLTGFDYYYPTVQPTLGHDMVIGFGRSSQAGEFPSLRYTVWPDADPLEASELVQAGTGSYTNGSWGDYFALQLDPASGTTVWLAGEYSLGGTNWGTWTAEISLFDPGLGGS